MVQPSFNKELGRSKQESSQNAVSNESIGESMSFFSMTVLHTFRLSVHPGNQIIMLKHQLRRVSRLAIVKVWRLKLIPVWTHKL